MSNHLPQAPGSSVSNDVKFHFQIKDRFYKNQDFIGSLTELNEQKSSGSPSILKISSFKISLNLLRFKLNAASFNRDQWKTF